MAARRLGTWTFAAALVSTSADFVVLIQGRARSEDAEETVGSVPYWTTVEYARHAAARQCRPRPERLLADGACGSSRHAYFYGTRRIGVRRSWPALWPVELTAVSARRWVARSIVDRSLIRRHPSRPGLEPSMQYRYKYLRRTLHARFTYRLNSWIGCSLVRCVKVGNDVDPQAAAPRPPKPHAGPRSTHTRTDGTAQRSHPRKGLA